jgi:hypothetical protein
MELRSRDIDVKCLDFSHFRLLFYMRRRIGIFYLLGVYLTDVHLTGVHLTGMCLMGVYLIGVICIS